MGNSISEWKMCTKSQNICISKHLVSLEVIGGVYFPLLLICTFSLLSKYS